MLLIRRSRFGQSEPAEPLRHQASQAKRHRDNGAEGQAKVGCAGAGDVFSYFAYVSLEFGNVTFHELH